MPWAEDVWNILMFSAVVNSKFVVNTKLEPYEIGDIILWIAAMYDLYFEYKVVADYEYIDNYEYVDSFICDRTQWELAVRRGCGRTDIWI